MKYNGAPIYRFQFSDNFMIMLKEFSLRHREDTVEEFKETWEKWCSSYARDIKCEEIRLRDSGYEGQIGFKMYKSVRYYLKNLSLEQRNPKKRSPYRLLKKELIREMDRHIEQVALLGISRPAHAFNNFEANHEYNQHLAAERKRMGEQGIDHMQAEIKIKKAYKNRLYILQHR